MFPTQHHLAPLEYATKSLSKLRGVSFALLNIRSLSNKIDDLRILLHDSDLDFLCLTESHLKSSIEDAEIKCDGYNLYRYDRNCNSGKSCGGGLAIYTKSQRSFVEVSNSHICNPHIEICRLKLELKNARDTYVCCVYRAPDGSLEMALDTINQQTEDLSISYCDDLIFLGDYNVDLLTASPAKTRLDAFSKTHNLDQLVKVPTRVCQISSTLIDHLYVNNALSVSSLGSLEPRAI